MSLIDNFKQPTSLIYLAIPRIFVGYHFLDVGIPKVLRGFTSGEKLPQQLGESLAGDPFGWHRAFIEGFVMAHPVLFSYLVAYGEVAIGLSLVFGCLVRVSSSFGAFHNFNILLSLSIPGGAGNQIAVNAIFIALHLMFVFAGAGRALGLDGLLKKQFPKSFLFSGSLDGDWSSRGIKTVKTYLGYLAIPRIVVGAFFIYFAIPKMSAKFLSGDQLVRQLSRATGDPIGWHRDFILHFVVPHAHAFGYLVAFGEMALGVSLVLGCLVRLSSLVGAFHNLNIYFAMAIPAGGAQLGLNRIFIVLQLMFLFASAGTSLGIDAALKKKFQQSKWI